MKILFLANGISLFGRRTRYELVCKSTDQIACLVSFHEVFPLITETNREIDRKPTTLLPPPSGNESGFFHYYRGKPKVVLQL